MFHSVFDQSDTRRFHFYLFLVSRTHTHTHSSWRRLLFFLLGKTTNANQLAKGQCQIFCNSSCYQAVILCVGVFRSFSIFFLNIFWERYRLDLQAVNYSQSLPTFDLFFFPDLDNFIYNRCAFIIETTFKLKIIWVLQSFRFSFCFLTLNILFIYSIACHFFPSKNHFFSSNFIRCSRCGMFSVT